MNNRALSAYSEDTILQVISLSQKFLYLKSLFDLLSNLLSFMIDQSKRNVLPERKSFDQYVIFFINSQFQMHSELEKKNLEKILERYSFEHLRPSPEVYEIIVPQEEFFLVSGKDRRRRVYFKVDYESEELEAIQEIKQRLNEDQISHPFGDEILLKHIYSAKWSMSKASDRIKQLLAYHNNEEITRFDNNTISNLESGRAYCYGHDRGMRPNVIMRIDKFDFKQPIQNSFNSFYYLMLVVLGFKMVPYHAQKYNLIMDFNDISLTDIPYVYLYDALEKLGIYYCCNTQKTFLFNSQGISNIWRMVSFFLSDNQKKRIIFLNKGEEKKILQYIDQYEIEKKYGGKLPNLTSYWPPKNTNEQFDVNLNEEKNEESFYSVENNEEFFDDGTAQTGICGNASCECEIF